MVEKPQDTGCTTIEVDTGDEALDEGVTNGILSGVASMRDVEYDEENDVYRIGEAQ